MADLRVSNVFPTTDPSQQRISVCTSRKCEVRHWHLQICPLIRVEMIFFLMCSEFLKKVLLWLIYKPSIQYTIQKENISILYSRILLKHVHGAICWFNLNLTQQTNLNQLLNLTFSAVNLFRCVPHRQHLYRAIFS